MGNKIKAMMRYWRSSLADAARMTIDPKKAGEDGINVTIGALKTQIHVQT
ncbi:hypothetical protein ABNB59_20090 [Paenibacillus larvae]|uniref:Uncharacterized protein n=2 Tax=Paenibacillus larvae TaxID=1464 RepID=V9W2W2_9BACL|nr:hypothetical protein [Paenibacillus larvae]AHD05341.1 hypothetical protein ERIC2_c15140 [Paenibacillus larvae subsp. larvae DSM 25430]ETK28072.1 hypothetical protein ERIC1_1c15290 [Paenibacillus larvae subsp. larvae DSM 25719]MCY7478608.1 hypothetical protein [Paenibacillus larvae]MCY7491949.1 hypothetical protein [Paenibacillus larvae]MCY9565567.1 hypothetical protein [Paenibacillus larvae]